MPASPLLAVSTCSTVLHTAVVTDVITLAAPPFYTSPLPVNWSTYSLVFFLNRICLLASDRAHIGAPARNSRCAVIRPQIIYLHQFLWAV